MQKITKSVFISELGAKANITRPEAERILNTAIRLIYEYVGNGITVNISGFGAFSVSHREARIGVDPRHPRIKITIPELRTPKFKSGEKFKQMVAIKK